MMWTLFNSSSKTFCAESGLRLRFVVATQTSKLFRFNTLLLQNPSRTSCSYTSVIHISLPLFCWGENYPLYPYDTDDLWYDLLYEKVENNISNYPSCSFIEDIYKMQGLCHSPYYWAVQLHHKVVLALLSMDCGF